MNSLLVSLTIFSFLGKRFKEIQLTSFFSYFKVFCGRKLALAFPQLWLIYLECT